MANIFETEISHTFDIKGWHAGKLCVIRHTQPYHFWAIKGKYAYGLEAKSTRLVSSFPFARMADHQIAGLLECDKQECGKGYILLNFRSRITTVITKATKTKKAIKKKRKQQFIVAYAIRIQDFEDIRKEMFPVKSIPFSVIESDSRFIKLERKIYNRRAYWELDTIIE